MGYLRNAGGFWELLRFWFPFGWIPFVVVLIAGSALPFGVTAVLLMAGSLLAGGSLLVVILPLLPEENQDGDLQAMAHFFETPGEYTLGELHHNLGISRRRAKQLVQELLPLELYNIAFNKKNGIVYISPRREYLETCPRCSAQLPEDGDAVKCPGCRSFFSRAVSHQPYSFL